MMGRQTGMLRWAGKRLASQGGTFLLISRMLLSPTGNFRSARGLLGLPTGMLQGKGELVQAQTGRAGDSASAKGGRTSPEGYLAGSLPALAGTLRANRLLNSSSVSLSDADLPVALAREYTARAAA